jgi:hypothetical protein
MKDGDCYHTINGIECPYNFKDSEIVESWINPKFMNASENALKGAAVLQQQQRQQPQRQFLFSPKEMNFIDQVLKVAGYKVSGLEPQTEEYKNMINDISNILKMISAKTKNQQKQNQSIKGASDMNRLQALDSIRNMFGLNVPIKNIQLKGASQQKQQQNICNKKQALTNLRNQFGLV